MRSATVGLLTRRPISGCPPRGSERVAQTELNDSAGSSAQNATRVGVADGIGRGTEVRVVQKIEELRPKLYRVLFMYRNALEERYIPVLRAGTINDIAPGRAVGAVRRKLERRGIKITLDQLSAGPSRIEIGVPDQV